ncbi:ExbD/TolR family protein [Roseateles chitinivorans]|uniref:ExbD/TolR family protein n=1 Tax=Roseateles chitinivorans TaxID=2917965 RepID=UPI003D67CC39
MLLVVVTLWIMAIRAPLHSVDFDIPGDGCLGFSGADAVRVDTVTIDGDGLVVWNGEILTSREALESRMLAIDALGFDDQPVIRVEPREGVSYGAFLAFMATAQRHRVGTVRMIGDGAVEMRVLPAAI